MPLMTWATHVLQWELIDGSNTARWSKPEKHSLEWFLFFNPGSHLLSHTVSSIVPSAAYVLTVVFGMGTGVSHKRIDTRIL